MIDDENRQDGKLRGARRLLDQAASGLDTVVTARLTAARRQAVEAAEVRRGGGYSAWGPPLSAAVAATLVVAVTLGLLWRAPEPPLITAATEDIEWLTAKESPDLFSEQLEFYDWLGDDNGAS